MREIAVRIQFSLPCLGDLKVTRHVSVRGRRKRRPVYKFRRDPATNKVLFLPTWWQIVLKKAADVNCRHQSLVKSIVAEPTVDGHVQDFKRYHTKQSYTPHEAFLAGEIVGVNFAVPEISNSSMWSLLNTAGRFYGISPYRPDDYGRFTVVGIKDRSPVQLEQVEDEVSVN